MNISITELNFFSTFHLFCTKVGRFSLPVSLEAWRKRVGINFIWCIYTGSVVVWSHLYWRNHLLYHVSRPDLFLLSQLLGGHENFKLKLFLTRHIELSFDILRELVLGPSWGYQNQWMFKPLIFYGVVFTYSLLTFSCMH